MAGRSFILTYIVPTVGLVAFGFGTITVLGSTPQRPAETPTFEPPNSATVRVNTPRIGAVGVIEPEGEAIEIGAHRAGVVEELLVKAGDKILPGAPLFRIDQRLAKESVELQRAQLERERARLAEVRSEITVTTARLRQAEAQLLARESEVQAAAATLRGAQADATDRRQRADRAGSLVGNGSFSVEETESLRLQSARAEAFVTSAEASLTAARASVEGARADLERVRAELAQLVDSTTNPPADGPIVRAQQAALEAAEAALGAAEVELAYLTVTAPREATVLQVNVRVGEYVAPGLNTTPPLIIGNLDPLHVRVRIDEADALRFSPEAPAVGSPRGDATKQIPLRFVRIEPLVVPKRSLSGASTEFVDTQVMEVLFAIDGGSASGLQPGMRMDVYMEASR